MGNKKTDKAYWIWGCMNTFQIASSGTVLRRLMRLTDDVTGVNHHPSISYITGVNHQWRHSSVRGIEPEIGRVGACANRANLKQPEVAIAHSKSMRKSKTFIVHRKYVIPYKVTARESVPHFKESQAENNIPLHVKRCLRCMFFVRQPRATLWQGHLIHRYIRVYLQTKKK